MKSHQNSDENFNYKNPQIYEEYEDYERTENSSLKDRNKFESVIITSELQNENLSHNNIFKQTNIGNSVIHQQSIESIPCIPGKSHSYTYFEELAPKRKMRVSESPTLFMAQQNEALDFSASTSRYYQNGSKSELLNASSHSLANFEFSPESSIVDETHESPYGAYNVYGYPRVSNTVWEACKSPYKAYNVIEERDIPLGYSNICKKQDSSSASRKYALVGRNAFVSNFGFTDSGNKVEDMNRMRSKRLLYSSTDISDDEDKGAQKKRIRRLEKDVFNAKNLYRKEKQKREKDRKCEEALKIELQASLGQKDNELQAANSSIREMAEEILSLRLGRESDRAEIESLKKENVEVRKRNDDLQDCVINYVKSKGSYSREADKENESTLPAFQVGTFSLSQRDLELTNKQDKPSLFVKEFMDKLWSREDLAHRSLTGKVCPKKKRFGGRPNQPLTPEKVDFMRECLKSKLQTLGLPEKDISGVLKLFNRYVSEKLNDIQKAESHRRRLKFESCVGS